MNWKKIGIRAFQVASIPMVWAGFYAFLCIGERPWYIVLPVFFLGLYGGALVYLFGDFLLYRMRRQERQERLQRKLEELRRGGRNV